MRRAIIPYAFAVLLAGLVLPSLFAGSPGSGERKSIVVFALERGDMSIPLEALGRADREIRQLFVGLGPFKVIGMAKRLSPETAEDLVEAVTQAKRAGRAARGPRRFGEAGFSKSEFDTLLKTSYIAVPFLSKLESSFDEGEDRWEAELGAGVAVFDLSFEGAATEIARVESSGFDEEDRDRSISMAVEALPMLLQYELPKVAAFRIGARVLSLSGREIELELGGSEGARKGDEYALLAAGGEEGGERAAPLSLVAIRKVGPKSSAGRILYSREALREGARLEEVPRIGVDLEPYLHFIFGGAPNLARDPKGKAGGCAVAGLRVPVSRGFYGLRPYGAIQVPTAGVRGFGSAFLFPLDLLVGAEYRRDSGRLSLAPYCGAGVGFVYASETIYGGSESSSEALVPHVGGHAYLDLAFLASRDIRIFAELGGEYWFSTVTELYTDYGGVGFGAGVSIKL